MRNIEKPMNKKNTKSKRPAVRAQRKVSIVELRAAVANYLRSEGCSCCEGIDHEEHKAALAKLLGVRKYKDGSGYNFAHYEANAKLTDR